MFENHVSSILIFSDEVKWTFRESHNAELVNKSYTAALILEVRPQHFLVHGGVQVLDSNPERCSALAGPSVLAHGPGR